MDIINDIREQYNSLTRTQKRIADYILGYTDTACFQTLKDWSRITACPRRRFSAFAPGLPAKTFWE